MIDGGTKKRIINASTLAAQLGSTKPAIDRLRRKGELPEMKIGRTFMFPEDAAEQYIETKRLKSCQDQNLSQNSSKTNGVAALTPSTTTTKMASGDNEARVNALFKKPTRNISSSASSCQHQKGQVIPLK
jgi:excisionase family DNA binding protein